MTRALLRGPDHTEAGAVAVASADGLTAVALSRGLRPKPYAYLDPNEDVAAAVCGPRARLLVVADAHDGADSAVAAVDALVALHGSDPPSSASEAQLVSWLAAAGDAAFQATRAFDYPRRGSRAAVGLALVAPGEPVAPGAVTWAVVGDVAFVVVGPAGQRVVNPLEPVFLGGPMEPEHVRGVLRWGVEPLAAGEWAVLASDGLLNFAPSGPGAVLGGPTGPGLSPAQAADALVRAAFAGGAGDNVAVALVAPP